MRLKAHWPPIQSGFLLTILFLAISNCCYCEEEKQNDGLGSKVAKVFKHFQMRFRGDGNEIDPPFPQPGNEIDPPFPPKPNKLLEQVSLAQYCEKAKPGARIQLGDCSPTYIVCESEALRFENCPTGQVFADRECQAAAERQVCHDVSSNQLNHATEKLVGATSFCRVHSAPGFIHLAAQPNKCSRQALICISHDRPLAVACPQGTHFDADRLECQKTSHHCQFAEKSMVQPVKTALERLYCLQHGNDDGPGTSIPPPFPGQFRSNDLSSASNGMHCRDWFVTCPHQDKEFVFCGQDSLFDKELDACRPTRPSDNCPAIFNCRGFEWQIIPFGKCRPEFIYCRGLIPVQFQCKSDYVLQKGKCVLAENVRDECQSDSGDGPDAGLSECELDERKPDSKNCTRFFQCDADANGVTRWDLYECPLNEGYDPHLQDCSMNYQCGAECHEGQSFLVSCYEYFQCRNHRFQAGVCPSKSKYSVDDQRCVFDSSCRHRDDQETDEQQTDQCRENDFIPSKDCISYGVCKQGMVHWKPCQLLNGKYHDQCPGCSAQSNPSSHEHSHEKEPKNPDADSNFVPTECTDGAVVLSKNDCKKFMKCYSGHWFMVECPNDKFFSLETQACTADKCENAGVYLPPSSPPDSVPDYKPPVGQPSCTDSFCCTKDSPKLPIHTDCQRYKECDVKSGRYVEHQCAFDQHFSAKHQKCVKGSECEASGDSGEGDEYDSSETCTNDDVKPLRKCGHMRICINHKWSAARCKNNMKFVKGRCSKKVTCDKDQSGSSKEKEEYDEDVCLDGESKRHPYSCNKYLVCDHGIFIERICSYGALFNPKTKRCDLNYECDYANQPKCYEGQLKSVKQNCHGYLRCYEGQYVEETCPDEKVFHEETKTCVRGKCYDENEDSEEEKSKKKDKSKEKKHKSDEEEYESEEKEKKKKKKPKKKHESSEGSSDDGAPGAVPCKESPGPNGYRRDRHRCERFFQCSNGDWVPKTCPSGTVFNTHIGVCDWPRNVPGCEDD